MVTLLIVQLANKIARFGKEARDIWREAQRLRRAMPGSSEE